MNRPTYGYGASNGYKTPQVVRAKGEGRASGEHQGAAREAGEAQAVRRPHRLPWRLLLTVALVVAVVLWNMGCVAPGTPPFPDPARDKAGQRK